MILHHTVCATWYIICKISELGTVQLKTHSKKVTRRYNVANNNNFFAVGDGFARVDFFLLRYKPLFNQSIHCHLENFADDLPTRHCSFSRTISLLTCSTMYFCSPFAFEMRNESEPGFTSHIDITDSFLNQANNLFPSVSYGSVQFHFILMPNSRQVDAIHLVENCF